MHLKECLELLTLVLINLIPSDLCETLQLYLPPSFALPGCS